MLSSKTNSLKHRHAHLLSCLGMSSLFFSGSAKSSLTTSPLEKPLRTYFSVVVVFAAPSPKINE